MWRIGVGLALLSCGLTAVAQGTETSRGVGKVYAGPARARYPVHFGNYHALLIGVSDYGSDKYKPLDTPVKDVRALKKNLVEVLGWKEDDVRLLTDGEVTADGIKSVLEEYARTLTERDNLFIWFAGHGEEGETKGDWFWIMQDGTPLKFRNVLDDRLERIPVRHLLIVSDSCFAAVDSSDTYVDLEKTPFGVLQERRSRQLITSGEGEPVPDSGIVRRTGERSPFAHAFLQYVEGMKAAKEPRTAWQVLDDVREAAKAFTTEGVRPTPRCGFLTGDEQDNGQFFFVPPGFYARQRSRLEVLDQTELRPAQQEMIEPRGTIHGVQVFAPKSARAERDNGPMVLVKKTYVEIDSGSKEPIEPFLIDLREVTVRQFRRFLASGSGGRQGARYLTARGYNQDDQPIVGITLDQAKAYAAWAGKELPDEHQWLAAAALRWVPGPEGNKVVEIAQYPWSDRKADLLTLVPWRAYPPSVTDPTEDISPWGVERMGTGVREWCLRWDHALGRGVIRGGTVVRTNSLDTKADWISRWRLESRADIPRANVGFRCIVTLGSR